MPDTIERLGTALRVEESMLPVDGHPTLYLRNKRPADRDTFGAASTVVFCHGATYASSITFDLTLDGFSWMDYLAAAGFDTWSLDLRGYGRSARPAPMEEPPEAHGPIVHTDLALADLSRAIEHILAERGIEALCLIGYSWGSRIAGAYAARTGAPLHRLVLYATRLVREGPSLIGNEVPPVSYRLVSAQQAIERWRHGLGDAEWEDIVNPAWAELWLEAMLASDPRSGEHDPPAIRAPTGVVEDSIRYGAVPYYDPGTISVPTLVVVGERDRETTPAAAHGVFEALAAAPSRQYLVIGKCTHSMFMERRREELFAAVRAFLRG